MQRPLADVMSAKDENMGMPVALYDGGDAESAQCEEDVTCGRKVEIGPAKPS
jgi:hypothetical protein